MSDDPSPPPSQTNPSPSPSAPTRLPSPTFIPSPAQAKATSVLQSGRVTLEFPTLGSIDLSAQPAPPPPLPSSSRASASSIFSPSYQPHPGSSNGGSPPGFSLSSFSSSAPSSAGRRLEVLPHHWMNSDADYIPLIPITVIALLTLYVLYLCLPTESQFLAAFSSSPSTLTPFHQWSSPHYEPPLPFPSFSSSSASLLGRKQQLASLHILLSSSHTATVTGRAGVGKTALVDLYIHQFAVSPSSSISPPYNVVLRLSALSEAALQADVALLHATLQLPLLVPSSAGLRASLVSFLSQFARYLVVFDDCRLSPSVLSAYLPRRTGRDGEGLYADVVYVRESRRDGGGSGTVNVGGLTRSHAVRLLSAASGRGVANDSREQAEALVELLDRTPQAVALAGLYVKEEGVQWEEVTAVVKTRLSSASSSPVQAMIRAVLALPAFAASLPALSALSLLANGSSSLPLLLFPSSFPLPLYIRYGLMYSTQHSFPYSHFRHLLFANTEEKSERVFLLKEMMRWMQDEAKENESLEAEGRRVWEAVERSGMVDVLVVAGLASFLHPPFHHEVALHLPSGCPPLPLRPFPSLPALSLSSFHLLHSPSVSSVSLVQSVFGSASALSWSDFSLAQAAALLPPLLSLIRSLSALYSNVSLRVSSPEDRIIVEPLSLPAFSPPFSALPLLLVLGCFVADVQRDYATSSRLFTTASALAMQRPEEHNETLPSALLLLAVNHLARGDHRTALSLLSFLHQQHLPSSTSPSPPSPSPPSPVSIPLQADILSALAISYMRSEGQADEVEPAFTAAMSTRQRLQARTALVHLLTCRDLLLLDGRLRASSPLNSLAAQSACQHIESGIFSSSNSYAAAARQLSLALQHQPHNLSASHHHFVSATSMLSSLPASTPDPRLALALLQHIHALSSASPSASHSLSTPSPAVPILERLFAVLTSSHPRGLGVYSLPVLQAATAVLAGEGLWAQGMDVVRQGFDAVRGEGVEDEGWRRVYGWLYALSEKQKAEEKRREEEKLREAKRKQREEAETQQGDEPGKQTEL